MERILPRPRVFIARKVAAYTYAAWGNIESSLYSEAYDLNHMTYKSYNRDYKSGFYYLQSLYYDPENGRFINADDIQVFKIKNLGFTIQSYKFI